MGNVMEETRFPLNRSKPHVRRLAMFVAATCGLLLLIACLMLLAFTLKAVLTDGDWLLLLLMLLPLGFSIWFAGFFFLLLGRMMTSISLTGNGVCLYGPLQRSKWIPWDAFQQVCICYGSGTPGKNDGNTVLCFVQNGEKKNLYDRWKVDNPWRDRLISADYTEELYTAVCACCPMEVTDLRGTIAYPHPKA